MKHPFSSNEKNKCSLEDQLSGYDEPFCCCTDVQITIGRNCFQINIKQYCDDYGRHYNVNPSPKDIVIRVAGTCPVKLPWWCNDAAVIGDKEI